MLWHDIYLDNNIARNDTKVEAAFYLAMLTFLNSDEMLSLSKGVYIWVSFLIRIGSVRSMAIFALAAFSGMAKEVLTVGK